MTKASKEGSTSPERELIVIPAIGEKPIEVSNDLPSFTAVTEAPDPK